MITLAEFIKDYRAANRISMRELAESAGVSHTEISRIEKGERVNPGVRVIKKLAHAMRTDFSVLAKIAAGISDNEIFAEPEYMKLAMRLSALPPEDMAALKEFAEFLEFKRRKK